VPDRGGHQFPGALAGNDIDVTDRPTGISANQVDPDLQRLLDRRRRVGGDRDPVQQAHQRVLALEGLGALFLVLDLGYQPEPFDDPPLPVAHGLAPGEKPAVHAVGGPLQAVVDLDQLPGLQRPVPDLKDPWGVLRVEHAGPARTPGLLQRHAGEGQPELVGVVDRAVGPGGPDDSRDEVGQRMVLLLTGAQGLPRLLEDADRRLRLGPRLPLPDQQPVALFLGPLALGDVLAQGDAVGRSAVPVAPQRDAVQHPDDLAALLDVALLDVEVGDVARQQPTAEVQVAGTVVRVRDGDIIGRQEFRFGIARHRTVGGVHLEKTPRQVRHGDADGGVGKRLAKEVLPLRRRGRRLLPHAAPAHGGLLTGGTHRHGSLRNCWEPIRHARGVRTRARPAAARPVFPRR
jgi:hypothetical protein